jgi:hypothetical protein
MRDEILTPEESVARKIRRIQVLIANRTDHGTFDGDEESEHLAWLLEERARLEGELESTKDSVRRLSNILLQNAEIDGDDL